MGYEISCFESLVAILRPKSALAALKGANRQVSLFEGWDEVNDALEAAETLEAGLKACGWDAELDSDGRIEKLFYEGKLLTDIDDVERLFRIVAPFVRTGSFLMIEGEDGARWRFSFAKGGLRVSFDDHADEDPG